MPDIYLYQQAWRALPLDGHSQTVFLYRHYQDIYRTLYNQEPPSVLPVVQCNVSNAHNNNAKVYANIELPKAMTLLAALDPTWFGKGCGGLVNYSSHINVPLRHPTLDEHDALHQLNMEYANKIEKDNYLSKVTHCRSMMNQAQTWDEWWKHWTAFALVQAAKNIGVSSLDQRIVVKFEHELASKWLIYKDRLLIQPKRKKENQVSLSDFTGGGWSLDNRLNKLLHVCMLNNPFATNAMFYGMDYLDTQPTFEDMDTIHDLIQKVNTTLSAFYVPNTGGNVPIYLLLEHVNQAMERQHGEATLDLNVLSSE
jgi:hypothetical protein